MKKIKDNTCIKVSWGRKIKMSDIFSDSRNPILSKKKVNKLRSERSGLAEKELISSLILFFEREYLPRHDSKHTIKFYEWLRKVRTDINKNHDKRNKVSNIENLIYSLMVLRDSGVIQMGDKKLAQHIKTNFKVYLSTETISKKMKTGVIYPDIEIKIKK